MITYVFPGQGSQFKGMGQDLFKKYPEEVRKASEILGYDVADLCLNDPRRNLNKTQYTQPALYVVNALTYFEYRNTGKPQADFLAGHSLGEYNALLAAQVFDFETGLKLVKKRGELIAQCPAGGMAAVIGLTEKQVRDILRSNQLDQIDLANLNSPGQIIISGKSEEIERAQLIFEANGAKRFSPLNVSGPFHSRYMNQARDAFFEYLQNFSFNDFQIPVISNLEAVPYASGRTKEILSDQINHSVRWCESMCYLWGLGQKEVIELGPGRVLTDLWNFIKKEGQPQTKAKGTRSSPDLKNKPMAVIGMSCRFPGADDYNEFWNNLMSCKKAVSEFPEVRHPIRTSTKGPIHGSFIDGVDLFDPQYFNLSPKEAKYIDPQHRVFLQTALKCIEDAGYRLADLSGQSVGVYAGVSGNDYAELMRESHESIEAFVSTGTVHSILSNRVSFVLNLKGPSETIETACASSLYAFYHAFCDLNQDRCNIALVGGVNLNLSKHGFISQEKAGLLAPDGQCKTFDESADGYGRGEGVAVFLLKPLDAAVADQDQIWGVIQGVSVNHSGKKQFPEFPSNEVQLDLMKNYRDSISHVEVHGASTKAGDANEFEGLKEVIRTQGESLSGSRKCSLGSVKPNIGHLESASGLGSLVKILLAMKYHQMPPSIYPEKLNASIRLEGTPFFIPTESYEWKPELTTQKRRMAALSVFGIGGSNACLFVEEPPTSPASLLLHPREKTCFLFIPLEKAGSGIWLQNISLILR